VSKSRIISRLCTFIRHLSYRLYYWKPIVTMFRFLGISNKYGALYFRFIKWTSLREKEICISFDNIKARFNVCANYPGGLFAIETLGDESSVLSRLLKSVKKGDTIFDVGAGLGMYTVLLSNLLDNTGLVVAFEPDKDRFDMLKSNVGLNKCQNVSCFQLALGTENSTAYLTNGHPSIQESNDLNNANNDVIQVVHGDSFVVKENLPIPAIVKIDVEGYEGEVLTGLKNILKDKSCKYILVEIHPTMLPPNTDEHTIKEQIRSFGFVLTVIRKKSRANLHVFGEKVETQA